MTEDTKPTITPLAELAQKLRPLLEKVKFENMVFKQRQTIEDFKTLMEEAHVTTNAEHNDTFTALKSILDEIKGIILDVKQNSEDILPVSPEDGERRRFTIQIIEPAWRKCKPLINEALGYIRAINPDPSQELKNARGGGRKD